MFIGSIFYIKVCGYFNYFNWGYLNVQKCKLKSNSDSVNCNMKLLINLLIGSVCTGT